jgi:L-iditol 2-dehydrogenase
MSGYPEEGSMASNRAAVLHAVRDLRIEDVPMPALAPDGVLIETMSVGVCGSDTHYLTHGRIGQFVVEQPMVLGHEASGVVIEVGDAVDRSLTPGARVAIEPGIACGHCRMCRAGRYNLCQHMRFLATPPIDGALVQYLSMPAANVFAIPDGMSYDEAALVEPLSVGIWAVRRAQLVPGDRVLVAGAGPVGLLAAEAARVMGAASVLVTDVSDARLAVANDHGHATRNVSTSPFPTMSEEFDVLLECSGAPGALSRGMYQLARGGRATMVGVPGTDEIPVPLPALHDREISVATNFRYANTWPFGIALLSQHRIDVSGLVTDHFPLAASEEALLAGSKNPATVKAVIHPQD